MAAEKKDKDQKKPEKKKLRKQPTGAAGSGSGSGAGQKERRMTERRREWHPPASNYFHTKENPPDFLRYPPVGLEGIDKSGKDPVGRGPVEVPQPVEHRAPIQYGLDMLNTAFIGLESTIEELEHLLLPILAVPPKLEEVPTPDYPGTSEMIGLLVGFAGRMDSVRVILENVRDRVEL